VNKIFYFSCVFIIFFGCSQNPEPLKYGFDSCEHCRMVITDNNYGAELITSKGKIFKYDSIECLAAYQSKLSDKDIHSMWVVNFYPPNELINTNDAYFLLSKNLKSPMGLYLSAYKAEASMIEVVNKYSGNEIKWLDLVEYVKSKWN